MLRQTTLSAHLYRLLLRSQSVPRATLVRALQWSLVRRASLVEALLTLDLGWGRVIEEHLSSQGQLADPSWRPASALLMELPPGLCEQTLSFPFRERAGKVEVVTVCPRDDWIRLEFEAHLGRPVLLYRGELQALLAAANSQLASMHRSAFRSHSELGRLGDSGQEEQALPLVRKSRGKQSKKQRVPTSPGLGMRGGAAAGVQTPEAAKKEEKS